MLYNCTMLCTHCSFPNCQDRNGSQTLLQTSKTLWCLHRAIINVVFVFVLYIRVCKHVQRCQHKLESRANKAPHHVTHSNGADRGRMIGEYGAVSEHILYHAITPH